MRNKIEAWWEKEGRNRDAVEDAKGDQGPKEGGGKERRSMLDYVRSHSPV